MNESTRNTAVRTALEPIRHKPLATAILTELDVHGRITDAVLEPLLDEQHAVYSTGEKVLLDLVLALCDYGPTYGRHAHPATALRVLGDRFLRAYVGALAIVATDSGRYDLGLAVVR